ncbi:PhzF family phenazine biosynthesis protein, partial [Pseudomonas aeruginosa]|nr:PhzF family phenazine biosynthesis protein [Pseudomonas aeruginosa]
GSRGAGGGGPRGPPARPPGPVAAYLVEYGLAARGEPFVLHQGRFLERPSRLDVQVATDGGVRVGGHVQLLARAELLTSA